jgi:hypothetical protein
MITLTREEAQHVLDALERALSDDQPYIVRCKQTVETLRARLTQPEPKPVAYLCENAVGHKYFRWKKPQSVFKPIALYTTPPQHEYPVNFIDALKFHTAMQELEPEPVAWGVLDDDGQIDWTCDYPFSDHPGWPNSAPLYTAPPKKEWVGLTEAERLEIIAVGGEAAVLYVTEAKLREKNNG